MQFEGKNKNLKAKLNIFNLRKLTLKTCKCNIWTLV
jgi:hypothetical protein